MSSLKSRAGRRRQRGYAWIPWAASAAAGILGNMMGGSASRSQQRMQDHYINNAIGIRIADARRQGIHPVAALGFSGSPGQAMPAFTGDWGGVGQDIGRAALAGMTQEGRDNYAAKELSQFASRARSNQLEMQDLELEMKRLQLNNLQQGVQNSAQGYAINPAEITASNPDLPSVQAGPAGPGFKATRIGGDVVDIGSSELSEWAEGAGLVGQALVPFWMYKQALARSMQENADAQEHAIRTGDPVYHAALRELRELGDDYYLHRTAGGWQIRKKYAPAPRGRVKSLPDDYQFPWRGEGWVPRRRASPGGRWDPKSRRMVFE